MEVWRLHSNHDQAKDAMPNNPHRLHYTEPRLAFSPTKFGNFAELNVNRLRCAMAYWFVVPFRALLSMTPVQILFLAKIPRLREVMLK